MQRIEFPNRITVELTNHCNVLCTFCNRNKICMDMGYMSEELFKKIVDEAANHLPVKLVPFFRGEPLMHPQIAEFIKYAKSKGLGPIQLATNALLLDEKMGDNLISSGLDYISFSLDTTDAELYSRSRLKGDLNVSRENVVNFCQKCRRLAKSGVSVPKTQVSTINLEEYKSTQEEFITFWKRYADVVRVYEQHDEKGRLVDEKLREKLDVFNSRKPCRKVFTDMIIYWDGRLALCNYDWDEKRDFGNINDTSIAEAWNSEEYEKIRKKHQEGLFEDEICRECHHWKIDYMANGYLGMSFINDIQENRKAEI